jgi:hypothetical protein
MMWCVVMVADREKNTVSFMVEPYEVTKERPGYRIQSLGIRPPANSRSEENGWRLVGGPFRSLAAAYGCVSTEAEQLADKMLKNGK